MDAAKPAAQLDRKRRAVPWADSFIDDIKTSLLTCRVLYVTNPPYMPLPMN